jgi:hypothetical protein
MNAIVSRRRHISFTGSCGEGSFSFLAKIHHP